MRVIKLNYFKLWHIFLHILCYANSKWRDSLSKLNKECTWCICGILRRMAQLEQWTDVGIKERENSKIVFCLGTSDLKKKNKTQNCHYLPKSIFDQCWWVIHIITIRKPLNMYANGKIGIKYANIKKLCWTTDYIYTCIIVINMHTHVYIHTYACILYIWPHIYVTYKYVYNLLLYILKS